MSDVSHNKSVRDNDRGDGETHERQRRLRSCIHEMSKSGSRSLYRLYDASVRIPADCQLYSSILQQQNKQSAGLCQDIAIYCHTVSFR